MTLGRWGGAGEKCGTLTRCRYRMGCVAATRESAANWGDTTGLGRCGWGRREVRHSDEMPLQDQSAATGTDRLSHSSSTAARIMAKKSAPLSASTGVKPCRVGVFDCLTCRWAIETAGMGP